MKDTYARILVGDKYERILRMSEKDREHWLKNAVFYGLACTCKKNKKQYCALHDLRLQELVTQKREQMKKEGLI